jgi:hypothetical protein
MQNEPVKANFLTRRLFTEFPDNCCDAFINPAIILLPAIGLKCQDIVHSGPQGRLDKQNCQQLIYP